MSIRITLPSRERRIRLLGTPATAPDGWMTQREAALYLGIHHTTLSQWTNQDDDPVPAHYLSAKEPRYRRSDLDAWVTSRPKRGAA